MEVQRCYHITCADLSASIMLGFLAERGGEDGRSGRSGQLTLNACTLSDSCKMSLSSIGRAGSSSGHSTHPVSTSTVHRDACVCVCVVCGVWWWCCVCVCVCVVVVLCGCVRVVCVCVVCVCVCVVVVLCGCVRGVCVCVCVCVCGGCGGGCTSMPCQ